MITRCCFCDYQKTTPLSEPILEVISEEDIPTENWLLWTQRLVETMGLKDYNGVKIHMGRMHKGKTYKYIHPLSFFEANETKIINRGGPRKDFCDALASL